jgi:hypothetical protein
MRNGTRGGIRLALLAVPLTLAACTMPGGASKSDVDAAMAAANEAKAEADRAMQAAQQALQTAQKADQDAQAANQRASKMFNQSQTK